ncbi:MAG: VCBS repeat-containing protein [Bacteroidales bacterium]|nr:VCBS repeat-containing protein [Bacteroidales bacterium]
MKKLTLCLLIATLTGNFMLAQITWVHLSSSNGDLEPPNAGKQQTSCAVADFDNDGINDFCISERTTAPGLVWYQRTENGWKRHIVEDAICFIEAGTIAFDVDNDGDLDILGKPYDGDAPGLDIWLQNGTNRIISR